MPGITPDERAHREERVRQACHSTEMEGLPHHSWDQVDLDAYARGEVDEAEMLRRFRGRYGLAGQWSSPRGIPQGQDLGEEAQDQVEDLTTQLVGPDVPGETPWEKVGRWNAAKKQAEEIVAADLLTPPREQWDPASDGGDEPDPWGLELQRMNQERLKDREREWDTILRQPTDG